jgi:ATP-binding cassette subfamily F protein 3
VEILGMTRLAKMLEFGYKRAKWHFEDIAGFLAHKKMESLRER